MTTVTLRRIEARDLDDWFALQDQAMADPFTRDGLAAEFDNHLSRPTGLFRKGELIAAFLGWLVVDELQIFQVATSANHRRQGLGRQLLTHVLRRARAGGATTATLEVRTSNAAAIALYVNLGFVIDGERKGFYPDGEDALLMRATLV
ncbi:MAG: ribosomal protein S18-alanine N-acetyltransferase [Myxococcales bacterium]|nr:ribosomal protein S18-alanine N-acetyltransferase [Myxococcales bacterium]